MEINMENSFVLLAPAGSFEALEAAVNAGADAVYLGGKAFGARAYANNFDEEELRRAVYFAHLHRVKILVTVNILIDDSEMEELARYLVLLYNIGVDGIIVQDMGVIRLARKLVPDLPLHASTQMTVTNEAGVKFAAENGMQVAVLARELSLKDIEKICQNTSTAIEVFIHGALCVCYSGQCLMSSLIGGRSGNRGRCAQPCRLPYELVDKTGKNVLEGKQAGQYLLSPRDMNTLEILPKLLKAGVSTLKIEGRMKRPEYVAVVVDAYRRAIDGYLAGGEYQVPEADKLNIEQIFNRDFTTAYLEGRPGKEMMSDRRPNNRGVLVGRVTELDRGSKKATLKLERDLHLGDGLEFWVTVGGRVGLTVKSLQVQGQEVTSAAAGTKAKVDIPDGVRMNDRVFRTLDSELMAYAGTFYGEKNKKRIPVTARVEAHLGSPLQVILTDDEGNTGCGATKFIVETARKHALTEETVRKQLERLGTTEYWLSQLQLVCDENVMVPMSEMNEARRLACEALDKARLEAFLPPRKPVSLAQLLADGRDNQLVLVPEEHSLPENKTELTVWTDTLEKTQAALKSGADWIIFGGDRFDTKDIALTDYEKVVPLVRKAGAKLAFSTPRIVRDNQLAYFSKFLQLSEKLQPDLLYLNNNSLFTQYQENHLTVPFWADMSLNTYNYQCLKFWQELGAVGATLSIELNLGQIEHLAKVTPLPLECLVQGYIEMMVSEYCAPGSFLGGLHEGACSFKCGEQLYLRDRTQTDFILKGDQFCRMHILNAYDLSLVTTARKLQELGIRKLRIDARAYDVQKTLVTVQQYKQVLKGIVEVEENPPHTTRGHYYRGVLREE
jgi:putative protease